MKNRYSFLSSLGITLFLCLALTGCNKSDDSGGSSSESSTKGSSNSGKSSSAPNRFVGTWGREGAGDRWRLTEDGKIMEAKTGGGEEQAGTYTVNGDKATVIHGKERPNTGTLEGDNRMRLEEGTHIEYWTRK